MPIVCLEGVADPLNAPLVHTHDVEGDVKARELGPGGKPAECRTPDALLLFTTHHLDGLPEVEPRPHLHLAKGDAGAAADNEVELAATDARVCRDDLVAAQPVVIAGPALGRRSSR